MIRDVISCIRAHSLSGRNLYVTPDGRSECKKCSALRSRLWRSRHPAQTKALAEGQRLKKLAVVQAKKNVPCADCGQIFPPVVMDFDHIGEKSFTISGRISARSIEGLLAEIAKCEVVCANCHRLRTHARRQKRAGIN